ncbi:choline transport protein [Metarhizium guizhouense ARSEF 977]|uniref:Choline transport protein n=1 Tax=Metarhizium guizhouense (strain ARSEF 977) TaxID=1276136 RepID=A0A0B4H441_METGA|nr:choline transport protein [Metarhizium guizhouense ARSEF 977]
MAQKQVQITDSNKSPLIQILSWFFMVVVILSAIARCGTKLHMVKTLKSEDWLAVAATIMAVAQFISSLVQAGNGLGQHGDALSERQIESILEGEYATELLYIASLGLAKVSTAATVVNIASRSHRNVIFGIGTVIIAWAVTGFIVVLFQCQLPAPWDIIHKSCIARPAFWRYFCAANVITDVALIGIIVHNIRGIQTSWSKKALVIGVFGSRILVAPALVFQIMYSGKSLATADPSFDMWKWSVIMAVVQCLNILTICIPNLKPFLDSLQSGQIRIDDLRRQGKSSSNGYGSHQGSGNKCGQSSRSNGGPDTVTSQKSKLLELVEVPKQRKAKDTPKRALTSQDGSAAWDGQSHTSQTILIQQTKTWHVDVETPRGSS